MPNDCVDNIFGGAKGWESDGWTASDDRVRGGKSQSYLNVDGNVAKFCGHLDIKTLGGAGFASQRTTGRDSAWDLSNYDGIELEILPSGTDKKKYTLTLKDVVPEYDISMQAERSTISWEYVFTKTEDAPSATDSQVIRIRWNDFKPTYRGRPKEDAEPLQVNNIRQFSFMMRSFFGSQSGDFELAICAVKGLRRDHSSNERTLSSISAESLVKSVKPASQTRSRSRNGFLSRLLSCCRI